MTNLAVSAPTSHEVAGPHYTLPASVEVMSAILDHYGFDHFFSRTLRKIDLRDPFYAEAVDSALDQHHADADLNAFSLKRAFTAIMADLRAEEDMTYEEALEHLAEEDYVVPVTTAMCYSVDAGDTDVERLSTLVQNRAQRLLRQLRRSRSN